MKTGFLLLALLILTTTVCIVNAEEETISISVCEQEYVFPLTGEAKIPVTISNVCEEDIRGTLSVKVYEPPETGSASSYQEKVMTAFSGDNTIYVPAGSSADPKTILVDIAFEYGSSPAYSSVLKGIRVSFTDSEEAPVTDTGAAGVTSKTEIRPSATTPGTYSSNTGEDLNPLSGESPDSAALQKTLVAEQVKDEFIRQQLLSVILNDSLFKKENSSFSGLNYSLSRIHTAGTDYGEGSFACNYHTPDRESEVLVSGIIKNGKIVNILEKTNNSVFLPAGFNENATLREMLGGLDSDGFIPTETTVNISQRGRHLEISLKRGIYDASIFAESENGNVTSLKMEKDKILPFYVLPLIIIVFALVNASALYLYFSLREETDKNDIPAETISTGPKISAMEMLDKSEELFRNGDRREAVCSAANVFRDWISEQFFKGTEISDDICTKCLAKYGKEGEEAAGIFRSTEAARYGGGTVSEEEFAEMIDTIRRFIRNRAVGL